MNEQEQRRLLELAAKAAGVAIEWNVMINLHSPILAPKTQQERRWLGHDHTPWNPLTDDGDALRLAIDLELDVSLGKSGAVVEFGRLQIEELDASDPYAAVRLAIVRTAAAIGQKIGAKP